MRLLRLGFERLIALQVIRDDYTGRGPSEGSIRRWCRMYGESFDFATDYQP